MTYGCKDRAPFAKTLQVQAGWLMNGARRMKEIDFRMSRECEFTKTELGRIDKQCAGCTHKQPGETQ